MYVYTRTPRGSPDAWELVVTVNSPNMADSSFTPSDRKKGMKFAGRKYPVKDHNCVEYTHGRSKG